MSEIVSLGPDLTRLLDWLPVPAFVRCRQGILRHVNGALISIAGASVEDWVGRGVSEFLPQDIARRVAEEDRRVLAGEIVHSETTFRLSGGVDFTMLVSKRRTRHPLWGDVIVGIGQDVSQRQDLERDETMLLLQHELQTPLSAISGLSELLLDSPLETGQRDSVRLIQASADACRALLTDMLGASKPGVGEWSLRPTEFSLREFLNDVLRPFEPLAGLRHLRLSYSIAEEVPDRLNCNPLRLRQVLQNLVGNAVKFTGAGSVEVSVKAVPDFTGGPGIHFSVRDTGIGIPKEQLSAILELFGQAHASSQRRFGKTGLGLLIAARIVTLLEGLIWVESEPFKGSVFSFVIPPHTNRKARGHSIAVGPGEGFDRKSALAIAGGDSELLKELAELFLQEYPRLIADLRTAAKEGDSKKLNAAAHALKGAVANFGARAAVEAALWLESKGRAGETEGVGEALASLEQIFEPLLVELASLRTEPAAS